MNFSPNIPLKNAYNLLESEEKDKIEENPEQCVPEEMEDKEELPTRKKAKTAENNHSN